MGWIHWGIKGSMVLLNTIVSDRFLTGSNETPKAARQLREKK
jgi:hypothetical protein